ncbi:MAG TPA: Spo0B domain-containing protein [Paenibacillus sp.]|uniref:Spo0B domain-containing protein n=1 Tax=Paenibacillus sp. TaxID=58172 RepID=UPI0028D25E82|nr:Spo0B domain-containing protein [Paenibacillus sp.]HUC91305.1 Spo0B domain-containing protein [Paenibacillus sp.]
MNRWRTIRYYAAGSVLLPIAAVWFWREQLWPAGALLLWLTAAAAIWIIADRKEQALRSERAQAALETKAIRMLNHHRHDWMNELQVLYGYIRMNKPDKTVECLEKIREAMTAESRIAKLGIPSFILFVQSFRTVTNAMQLQVDVADDVNLAELPLNGEKVADTLTDLINAYRFGVKPGGGDAARLTVGLHRNETALLIDLRFEGELLNAQELYAKCRQRVKKSPLYADRLEPDMLTAALRADLSR